MSFPLSLNFFSQLAYWITTLSKSLVLIARLFLSIINFVFSFIAGITSTPLSAFLVASFSLVIIWLVISLILKVVG